MYIGVKLWLLYHIGCTLSHTMIIISQLGFVLPYNAIT